MHSIAFGQYRETKIDWNAYAWETGTHPPSAPSNVLNIVGQATSLEAVFGIDLNSSELTIWVTGMVSMGETIEDGIGVTYYWGGTFELWIDTDPDGSYGIDPPNATAPSNFFNGTLFLEGNAVLFVVTRILNYGQISCEGSIVFTGGAAFDIVPSLSRDTTFFAILADDEASGGSVPDGYDWQVDANIWFPGPIAVQSSTISQVKALFR